MNNKTQVELQTSVEIFILAEAQEFGKQTAQKEKKKRKKKINDSAMRRYDSIVGQPEGGVVKKGAELGTKHQFKGKLSDIQGQNDSCI